MPNKSSKEKLITNIQFGLIATIPHIATSNTMNYWSRLTYAYGQKTFACNSFISISSSLEVV
ncbi:hypothetical protein LAV79_21105 [Peribacillus butanolivorans]|uniref:hypothetical protein n=1 Tax=Peribacillus butanolivorans TaxID=421767 RepID=UPI0030C94AB8